MMQSHCCSQNQSTAVPWLHALCHESAAGTCPYPALASKPIQGRFTVMLDILRRGASLPPSAQLQCAKHALPFVMTTLCTQLSTQACNSCTLRSLVTQAVVLFMAGCNTDR